MPTLKTTSNNNNNNNDNNNNNNNNNNHKDNKKKEKLRRQTSAFEKVKKHVDMQITLNKRYSSFTLTGPEVPKASSAAVAMTTKDVVNRLRVYHIRG